MSPQSISRDVVLFDTNAILEAYRTGVWRVLLARYRVETVRECLTEIQTGFRQRSTEKQIDYHDLRRSLSALHEVSAESRVALRHRVRGIDLDLGELSLWAHAVNRRDKWLLTGPDRASLRCGVRLGYRERLISLEELLSNIGFHSRLALNEQHTGKWLRLALNQIVINETFREHRRDG